MDMIYIGYMVGFFIVTVALVYGLDRLGRQP